jgi:hypothetical protein
MRSVIDVDVNDASFVRFKELFGKYTEALAKTPTDWKNATDEQRVANSLLESMTKRLEDAAEISHDNEEADEKRLKNLHTSEKLWSNISRSSASVAKSILDIGAGAIKLGSIAGLGLLGGSLFGIDRMAEGVSGRRRSAMGLGTSIGEQSAFNLDFGRAVDPNFLSMVNEMKSDPGKAWSLSTMGVGAGGSTADTATALLRSMYSRAHSTPTSQLGMLSSITGIGVGTDTWTRLHSMGSKEFNAQLSNYRRDASSLDPGASTALAWANLNTQLSRAGEQISNVFVRGLVPLAKPLEHLSSAVVTVVSRFLAGGEIRKGIDGLADGISKWTGTLTKPEFLSKLEVFVSDVGGLADAVHAVVEAYNHPAAALGRAVVGDFKAGLQQKEDLVVGGAGWIARKLAGLQANLIDSQHGLPAGVANFLWGKESSFAFDVANQPGRNGAQGPLQIKPSVAGGINTHSLSASMDRADWLVADELRRHKDWDIEKALAAYHFGDPTMDAILAQAKRTGQNWLDVPTSTDPKGARGYLNGLNITVTNQTGGSANVSVNSLQGGQ